MEFSVHKGILLHTTGKTSPKRSKIAQQAKKVNKTFQVAKNVNKIFQVAKKANKIFSKVAMGTIKLAQLLVLTVLGELGTSAWEGILA